MKIERVLVCLTVVNLALLAFLLGQTQSAQARGDDVPGVLRGRALQILDERGRTRASINVVAAGTAAGVTYPETVIFRLIDANGRPEVKIAASVDGAGVGLVGRTDNVQAALTATGTEARVKLQETEGRPLLLKPE